MHLIADYASRRKRQIAFHLVVAAGVVVMCGCAILIAVAFGLARWGSNIVLVSYVLGVATLWFGDRRRLSQWLLLYSAAAMVLTLVRSDLSTFARLSGMLPVIVGSSWLLKTAWRYCRALRCEWRIAHGAPYTLYLRPSMADSWAFEHFEAALADVLEPIGPTVFLEDSGYLTRHFPLLYRRSHMVRIPGNWFAKMGRLMRDAQLIVFFVMPRRGLDKSDEDWFWEELEHTQLKQLLPTGKVVLFFRDGWPNKVLNLVNKNGTVYLGETTLMREVKRVLGDAVPISWPSRFGQSRFLWFSPGAKPQSLGVFDESLCSRRRLAAELAPIFDYHGAKASSNWGSYVLFSGLMFILYGIGAWAPVINVGAMHKEALLIFDAVVSVMWLKLASLGVRKVRRWHRGLTYGFSYDYDNFVLHDKYRNLNWYEPPPEPFDEADGDNPLVQVAKPRRDYWRVFHDISLWICSFLIWPAAGLLAMPICNNWAQLFFFKSSLHWYPIPVNSTVLKLAGLLWGLRYAVSSAQVSPSFGYLLLEPFRPYLDILSGPDLDDHFCGVLSAFPLNLFLICSVTYGGVYLASRYLVVSHQTPLLLGDQIMYSLFAVLTAGSIASHGGRY